MKIFLKVAFIFVFVVGGIFILFNKEEVCIPRPYGHPRIILPNHKYVLLPNGYPYSFELSKYAIIRKRYDDKYKYEPYWMDIYYPEFDAEIQITYKSIKGNPDLLKNYCKTADELISRHQVRASSIEDTLLVTKQGYAVIFSDITGQVPTQVQFYVTDGKEHFIRGALYFSTADNNDYLEPIINYIREDMKHLLETLQF